MRRDWDLFPVRRSRDPGLGRQNDWEQDDWTGSSSALGGSPWQMMRRMQEDLDRVFNQFFSAGSGGQGQLSAGDQQGQLNRQGQTDLRQWAPSIDISQSDGEWCIEAELPGVSKDNIDVQVHDHHLLISAEMRQESEPQGGDQRQGQDRQYFHRERRYGYFQRVIPLPENVNEDDISCDFRNGVLTVHVPKAERQQQLGRRIPVVDADQFRAETASGRMRSGAELGLTGHAGEGSNAVRGEEKSGHENGSSGRERAMSGAKGGSTGEAQAASGDSTGGAENDAQSGEGTPARRKSTRSRKSSKSTEEKA